MWCDAVPPPPKPKPPRVPPSQVAWAQDSSLVYQFTPNRKKLVNTFDRILLSYTGKDTISDAWRTFVSPQDVVAIHLTCTGHEATTPPLALVEEVIRGLKLAGVQEKNIIVWDKFGDIMTVSGFAPRELEKEEWRLVSVLPDGGFDKDKFYFNEIAGKLIWGDCEFTGKHQLSLSELTGESNDDKKDNAKDNPEQISNRSHFAKILTKEATKIINIGIMSDHPDFGIYGLCASLALSSIDNSRRFSTPGVRGDPAIPEILNNTELKSKTVLHILSGMVAQFAGGPNFNPHYTRSAGILALSTDPVTLDTLSLEKLEAWRAEANVIPIGENAIHLKTAARLGLGANENKNMVFVPVE